MNIENVCQKAYMMWLKSLYGIYDQRGGIGIEYALAMAGTAAVVLAAFALVAFSYNAGPGAAILRVRELWDATIDMIKSAP